MYSIKDRLWFIYAEAIALLAHGKQKRKWDGEPYINHPRRVAESLKKVKAPAWAIVTALLHDVIEDTPLTYSHLKWLVGTQVADAVYILSYIDERHPKSATNRELKKKNYFDSMQNLYVTPTIKYYDMIDNEASIRENDPEFYNKKWKGEFDYFKKIAETDLFFITNVPRNA